MKNQPKRSRGLAYWGRIVGALALAACLAAIIRAEKQGQEGQSQEQGQSLTQQQQADTQEPRSKPKYPPQDADKPPYSKDKRAPVSPSGQARLDQPQDQQMDTDQAARPARELPDKLVIPAGTILLILTNDFLSSDRNQIGDQFYGVLDQPVVVNGCVVSRRGQTLIGQVKAAQKAGRVKGVSQLGLELTDLSVVSGQQLPILTELWKGSAGTSHGQDANTIAGTTGLGAIIGTAADWGRGAAIGAGVGAAAGIAAVLLTRGRPTEIEPETPLTFRLVDPVTVDTTSARMAFFPVTQQDFDGPPREHRQPRRAAGYPPPWWRPGCDYWPCYPYVAFYKESGYRRFH